MQVSSGCDQYNGKHLVTFSQIIIATIFFQFQCNDQYHLNSAPHIKYLPVETKDILNHAHADQPDMVVPF